MDKPSELLQGERIATTKHNEIRRSGHDIFKWCFQTEDNQRIEREAAILSQLEEGSNCPTVMKVGQEQGRSYIQMEYIEGISLRRLPPISPNNHLEIAYAICTTVLDIHVLDWIHCDIKPDNFILSDDDLRIIDFGSALSTEEATRKDMRFSFVTAGYAPPEVHLSKPWTVQGDIFSVGATLYYLVSGKPPFPGNQLDEISLDVCFSEPPVVDSPIWPVIKNCLQKDPLDRYISLGQALEDLTIVAKGGVVKDLTPDKKTLAARKPKRIIRPSFLYATTMTLVAFVFGAMLLVDSSLPVVHLIPVKFRNADEVSVQRITLFNKDRSITFRSDEVGYVPSGFYIAEFANIDGTDPYYVARYIPKTDEIAYHGVRRMFFLESRRASVSNDGSLEFVQMMGRSVQSKETAPRAGFETRKGKPVPPEEQRSLYRYASNAAESTKERLPTHLELRKLGLDPAEYLFLEEYNPRERKKIHYVRRNGKAKLNINKDRITRL